MTKEIHLPQPRTRKPPNYWNEETIETEAAKVVLSGNLSERALRRQGHQDLLMAIIRKYPGRLTGLKEKLGIKVEHKPGGYWTSERIEAEVRELKSEGVKISKTGLYKIERSDLAAAIYSYYPGSWKELRKKMKIKGPVEHGFWTDDRIVSEAKKYVANGQLNQRVLKEAGQQNLSDSIIRLYPGGFTGLRLKLGINSGRKDKYWNVETIEADVKKLLPALGKLTQTSLYVIGRQDLVSAVTNHYPGGFQALQENLGVARRREPNYWVPENIEKEAAEFLATHHELSFKSLKRERAFSLANAIAEKFPGGMKALQEKFAIERAKKYDYWDADTVLQEAKVFLEKFGSLAIKDLDAQNRTDLEGAIRNHYPGGFIQLRKDLNYHGPDKQKGIESANAQIEALLKD